MGKSKWNITGEQCGVDSKKVTLKNARCYDFFFGCESEESKCVMGHVFPNLRNELHLASCRCYVCTLCTQIAPIGFGRRIPD